jgi:hypothetical protein
MRGVVSLCPSHFIPAEGSPGTHWIGDSWGPEPVWAPWRREKSYLYQDSNPAFPARRPSLYKLSYLLHAGFLLFLFLTLKMRVICSSEKSIDCQRTTLRYIPGERTLHNHRCQNLKSYVRIYLSAIKQKVEMENS